MAIAAGTVGPGGAKFGAGGGGSNRYDHTARGAGLWSIGIDPNDYNSAVAWYNSQPANVRAEVDSYWKNNKRTGNAAYDLATAVDWRQRDVARKIKIEHSPLGDFGLPLTIAGAALGGAGLLGTFAPGAFGGAFAPGTFGSTVAGLGSKAISGIKAIGGAASNFLGGGGGGSGVGSTLLKAAPQLAGAALSYFGGDDDPYEQQLLASRNAEAQRQAARNANAGVVNSTLNNQDDYYNRLRSSVFDYQKNALDTRKTDEERELKFELARRGHLGGSQEVDAIGDLTRLYQQGLLDAGTLADNTVSSVRTNDQAVKQQALASVLNDADANQAIQNAVNQSNLGSAQALDTAKGQNLGDVFTGLSYLYQQGQQQKERQRATVDYYGRRSSGGVGPASSYSGSVNRKVA